MGDYKWSVTKTKALITLRVSNKKMFTKKRNSTKEAWDSIIKELKLEGIITPKQASKTWENLKKKYKELRKNPTGSGTDLGEDTPATWVYDLDMHEAMGSRPSVSPPVLIDSCLSSPTILPTTSDNLVTSTTDAETTTTSDTTALPGTSRSSPSAPQPPPTKKKRFRDLMVYLERDAEKEEERHQRWSRQNDKFLTLFEKLVDKM